MKKYELTFSQVVFLMRVPESSMGCHDVILTMNDNITKHVKVFNCNIMESSTRIDVNDIMAINVNDLVWKNKNK